ncbi:MAG: oligopeptidase B, partial [Thermoanaerobaculia bacterium]|nr:oligopeptidase B [Thermoanaerobaculia bacterium]
MATARVALATALMLSMSCSSGTRAPDPAEKPVPPEARRVPTTLEDGNGTRVDDWYWLRERDDPEVLSYLEAENAYLEAVAEPWGPLREELLQEITARIPKDDASVPVRIRNHLYYTRFEGDAEYPLYCRRHREGGEEEILLDLPKMAEGEDYFALGGVAISSDERTVAFAVDTVGRRIYTLRFKDLDSGRIRETSIPEVTSNFVWAEDGRTLFYTRQDPETLRWHRTYRHVLGTGPDDDVLVYEETDPEFSTAVSKTASRRFVLIASSQTLSSEVRLVDAHRPESEPRIFQPREPEHEYSVDHIDEVFFVRTNWQATNFRLMRTGEEATTKESWQEEISHRDDVLLGGLALFDDYLVAAERRRGLLQLRIRPRDGGEDRMVDFGEPAYAASLGANPETDTRVLRYHYSSMTTPSSVFDYDMASGERVLRKQDEVLGGFDASAYVTERIEAEARDGTAVPVSIVYRRDRRRAGHNPLLLYGYGSYGASIDAGFSSDRISLLDRGFVYAIAHIRGGQVLGRPWYEDG